MFRRVREGYGLEAHLVLQYGNAGHSLHASDSSVCLSPFTLKKMIKVIVILLYSKKYTNIYT